MQMDEQVECFEQNLFINTAINRAVLMREQPAHPTECRYNKKTIEN